MNLNKLTDQKLDEQLKSLAVSERELLSDILVHVREVDRRRLYLVFGYGSLFDYLTKSIGYGNGCAQRRIDAARLSIDVPAVIARIESGELNLSQVSLVQKAIRQVQSKTSLKIDAKTKEKLIEELADKSVAESEVLVTQTFNFQPSEATCVRHQRDESVRLEVTLSKVQWQKMLKMRELLSHSLPCGSWDQILEYVSDEVIQKKDKTNAKDNARAKTKAKTKEERQMDTKTNKTKGGSEIVSKLWG